MYRNILPAAAPTASQASFQPRAILANISILMALFEGVYASVCICLECHGIVVYTTIPNGRQTILFNHNKNTSIFICTIHWL